MTKKKQQIAIAKACGYTDVRVEQMEHVDMGSRSVSVWKELRGTKDGQRYSILNYTDDLNAMNEAEKIIEEFDWKASKGPTTLDYAQTLHEVCLYENIWHATAAQRAEAFLKTLNLWKN